MLSSFSGFLKWADNIFLENRKNLVYFGLQVRHLRIWIIVSFCFFQGPFFIWWTMNSNIHSYSADFLVSRASVLSAMLVVVWNFKISKWEESWTTLMLQLCGWSLNSLLLSLPHHGHCYFIQCIIYSSRERPEHGLA